MKRIFQFSALLILLLLMLAGCSRSFSIKGKVKGLGNQNLHVAWLSADGVKDQWVKCEKDQFIIKGEANELTLATIYTSGMQLLARFTVENGDHIQVRGDLSHPFNLEIKGSKVDEQWFQFTNDHAADYQNAATARLNQAIEKYVKAHPHDLLSTLLVLVDYDCAGDFDKASKLLGSIDVKAKPKWLIESCLQLTKTEKTQEQLGDFSLFDSKGGFSDIKLGKAPVTLLYLWRNEPTNRNNIDAIKQLKNVYGNRLQVADVYIEPDTMGWRNTLKMANAPWAHLWAPAGPLDKKLQAFGMQSAPGFAITDSTGKMLYRGAALNEAQSTIKSLLK